MKHLLNIVLFSLLFLTYQSSAQTIKGQVTDQDTGEGLPFANVILEKSGSQVTGANTDLDGYYEFTGISAGEYDLRVSYVGYQEEKIRGVKVAIGEVKVVDIRMGTAVLLEECVVTAMSIKREKKTMSYATQTIKADKLSSLPRQKSARKSSNKSYASKGKTKSPAPVAYSAPPSPPKLKPRADIQAIPHNTEDYSPIVENNYKEVKNDPLSTFSIDVDRASYSNVRRYITSNQLPPKDAVRIEEMVNYFDYDYPQPKSEHPFKVITELSDCPWNKEHKLAHIGLQGKDIDLEKAPNSNLVFLLDVSGSMSSPNKLPLLKSALTLLVNNLREEDRVAIVVYAGAAGTVLKSTPGTQRNKIISALDNLQAGGSTAGAAGIKLAYNIAKQNFISGGNNRVILATDGDFNVGVSSDGDLQRLIEEKRKDDVFLTVLGFGMGNYKDNKMEILADKGNGNYAYIDNIREAKKVLVNEMGGTLYTIAKDVKIQIEFNPVLVHSYRLIGYENRMLNKEDFNDDKKDAGELGAGHTVTALYEIVPAKKNDKPTATVDPLKYQVSAISSKAQTSKELMTVKLRYKQPTGKISQLIEQAVYNESIALKNTSDNFRFSASVAGFGLLLLDSKFKGDLSYQQVLDLAQDAKGKDKEGYRAEFIRLVETCDLQFAQVEK